MQIRSKSAEGIKLTALRQLAKKQAEGCEGCVAGYERLALLHGATPEEIERAKGGSPTAIPLKGLISRRQALRLASGGALALALMPLVGRRTASVDSGDGASFRELDGSELYRLRAEAIADHTVQAYRRELVGSLGYRPEPSVDGGVYITATIADVPHEGWWLWETYRLDDSHLAYINYEIRDGRVSVSAVRLDLSGQTPVASRVPLGEVGIQCNPCFWEFAVTFCFACLQACAPSGPAYPICVLGCCGVVALIAWIGCGCA